MANIHPGSRPTGGWHYHSASQISRANSAPDLNPSGPYPPDAPQSTPRQQSQPKRGISRQNQRQRGQQPNPPQQNHQQNRQQNQPQQAQPPLSQQQQTHHQSQPQQGETQQQTQQRGQPQQGEPLPTQQQQQSHFPASTLIYNYNFLPPQPGTQYVAPAPIPDVISAARTTIPTAPHEQQEPALPSRAELANIVNIAYIHSNW